MYSNFLILSGTVAPQLHTIFQWNCLHLTVPIIVAASRVELARPKAALVGRRETTPANLISALTTSAFKIQSSRVESSLYAKTMAGPSGHRREKEMNFNMYKKFPLNAGKS